ncbi:MAG TPA: phenylalanine--tRNA ligase subunit alpha [Candidatus Nanoarchaeia archaeon]|nr:phenylalanine--tRNA ligase subunit alpha [Candidatus Nanoarchaeia archaeon]
MSDINKLIESLSPHERKVLPHLGGKTPEKIAKESGLDDISVIRSLGYLQNKGIVKINQEKNKTVELGVNGALYKKKGLPERRLLETFNEKNILSLSETQKLSKLSNDEFKAAIGALKKKAMIEINKEKITLSCEREDIARKMPEEIFLDGLPLDLNSLTPEQKYSFESLRNRKNIFEIIEKNSIEIEITDLGEELLKNKKLDQELIESITPEILNSEDWKGKKFRRYDVTSPVPSIYGGKRHFVNQSIDYARTIWKDLGFKEMTGPLVVSSFWCFDALFQPQDHPAREMADTLFLDIKLDINADKKTIKAVKESHEKGIDGSTGWNYDWNEDIAKKLVLRTHTTSISSETISKLTEKNLPAKFFAIGKVFRNETVDWSHGFEFNQTEGIVVDKNANFRHLLGYLREFFKKMGYEKIRFRPCYYPYTEPSVEISFWHEDRKTWLELGGAGIFRPEVTIPLLGKNITILAWGPGFDRIIMSDYGIKDLRDLYKNDLDQLKKIKFWMK